MPQTFTLLNVCFYRSADVWKLEVPGKGDDTRESFLIEAFVPSCEDVGLMQHERTGFVGSWGPPFMDHKATIPRGNGKVKFESSSASIGTSRALR